jgi:hypothetical protein
MSTLGALGLAPVCQESNPNKVIVVEPEHYSNKSVHRRFHGRENALVLYGRRKETSSKQKYEIVLQRLCTETLEQAFRFV